MTPDSGMSPEDRAIFDRLSAAMEADVRGAAPGPPPADQLAALSLAVSQRGWFWVRVRARLGRIPSVIGMGALVAAVTAGVLLGTAGGHHGPPASGPQRPGPTTSSTVASPPAPPHGPTPPAPPSSSPNSAATAPAGASGQVPITGGGAGTALAANTQSPSGGTSSPSGGTSSPSGGTALPPIASGPPPSAAGGTPAAPLPPPPPRPPPPAPPPPPPPPPRPVIRPSRVSTTVFDAATNRPWTGREIAGASAYATAAVAATGPAATGAVTYHLFSNGVCSGPAATTDVVTLAGAGAVPNSPPSGPLAAIGYSFQAVYSGDSNYSGAISPCAPFTVNKTSPTVTTSLSASRATIDEPVDDSATLAGATATASGTVTYTVYTGARCTTPATTQISAQPPAVTVTDRLVPSSAPVRFLLAGTYFWRAVYSGDSDNNGATSACASESFTASQASSATTTNLRNGSDGSLIPVGGSVPVGTSVFDTATVTGVAGITPTGTVTYTFFDNAECIGTGQAAGGGDLVDGVPPHSSTSEHLATGTYAFRAVYSGDLNYSMSLSACENFTVQGPTSQITHGDSSCQAFTSGTATSVTAGRYSIKGTTINGVNPGVFSYYSTVTAPSPTFTTSILETNDSGSPPLYPNIPVDMDQVSVHNSACQVVSSGVTVTFPSTGDVNLTITGATPGATYIVSVKYSLTSLKDGPVPPKNPLTYTFSTDVNGTLVAGSQQDLPFEKQVP